MKENSIIHIGFITNGKNNDMLSEAIKIYENLEIPTNHELKFYVVGNLDNDTNILHKVQYLHFTDEDDKGWITKKKNLLKKMIRENQRTEEDISFVLADDLYPTKNTLLEAHKTLIKEKNEIVAPKIIKDLDKPNQRTFDWCTIGGPNGHRLLCFEDYEFYAYIDGSTLVFKTSISDTFHWNESLFLNQMEDVELSRKLIIEREVKPNPKMIFYGPKQNWPSYRKPIKCLFPEDCKCNTI